MQFIDFLKGYKDLFNWVLPAPYLPERGAKISLSGLKIEPNSSMNELTNELHIYIQSKIQKNKKIFGYGGYLEDRKMYQVSKIFQGNEPRSIHLGIDLWIPAYTKIRMPLDGIIHSYADNQNMGDYGPAIITEHFLEGRLFYMLFGHLSRNSIKDLQIGEQILKGTLFAELGSERENGNWPPHLHFQLISDIGDHFGDFPGVVKKSDIDNWLGICPDPGIIFNL